MASVCSSIKAQGEKQLSRRWWRYVPHRYLIGRHKVWTARYSPKWVRRIEQLDEREKKRKEEKEEKEEEEEEERVGSERK